MLVPGIYSFFDLLTVIMLGLTLNLLLEGPVHYLRKLGIPRFRHFSAMVVVTIEKRLNRSHRSKETRKMRGRVCVVLLAFLSLLLSFAIYSLSVAIPYGAALYIITFTLLVCPGSLLNEAMKAERSLKTSGLEASKVMLSPLVRRDIETLDLYAACRAVIEYLSENFADRVLSPILWFLLLGLPGLFFSRLINDADGIIGHRSSRFAAFGSATAATDTFLNFLPSRISGILLAISAIFVPRCHPLNALFTMLQNATKFASVNSGWPVAAMAGALDLTLGGPRCVEKVMVQDPWVGSGNVKATATDLRRAGILFLVSSLLLIISCAATLYII